MPDTKEQFLSWLQDKKYGHLAQKLKEAWSENKKFKTPKYVPRGLKKKIRSLK